jgi:hypothetical protein
MRNQLSPLHYGGSVKMRSSGVLDDLEGIDPIAGKIQDATLSEENL